MDLKKKIVLKNLNWDLVFSALIDLTAKEAAMVIHDVYQELNISENDDVVIKYTESDPDYGPFRDKATQKALLKVASHTTTNVPMNDADGEIAWQALSRNQLKWVLSFLTRSYSDWKN